MRTDYHIGPTRPDGGTYHRTVDADPGYADKRIRCTPTGIAVRGYYLPWGTKRIPYGAVRTIERVDLSAARGRGRIWGTANPGYWANLDVTRPRKSTGFVLDLGRRVKPFLTPDDPDGFESVVRARSGLGPAPADGTGRGPII
jgi:hypothetical protein